MRVRGFRVHRDTELEVLSPITAFCGLNGTGKTTLTQLAATAYRNGDDTYQVSDFFATGGLDANPFASDASAEFQYWNENRSTRSLTISRASGGRWSGYSRRPSREVAYIGLGIYLPTHERRDFVFRHARRLTIQDSRSVNSRVMSACRFVLGTEYDQHDENVVQHEKSTAKVLSVRRLGETSSYSESHMGCGEGRVQHIIRRIEAATPQSLVLIEEPETSLHQSAQYRLGQYFVHVSEQLGHQIWLTTHSDQLLEALPQASRVYLHRDPREGITPIPGLTSSEAVSLMTEGYQKALTVLVEDEPARALLSAIVWHGDPRFAQTLKIVVAGYKDPSGGNVGGGVAAITATMRALRNSGMKLCAVVDGNESADTPNFIFKLPGAAAPEQEMFACDAVRAWLRDSYGVLAESFLAAHSRLDPHGYFDALGHQLNISKAQLLGEAARAYASALPADDLRLLLTQLQDTAGR
jgi:predicted ATPase